MNALTLKRRRFYMLIFLVLFILIFPVLILYSIGYRLSGLNLVSNGALYVAVSRSGFDVSLNGEQVKTTNFFQKIYFNQNLKPGKYTVSVSRDGFYTWQKELDVRDKEVTEAYSFNLMKEPDLTEVFPLNVKGISVATSSESFGVVVNPTFSSVAELFGLSASVKVSYNVLPGGKKQYISSIALNKIPQKIATSSPIIQTPLSIPREKEKDYQQMAVWQEGNNIYAGWDGGIDSVPSFFCSNDTCKDKILVYSGKSPAENFDFYPGRNDLVIISYTDSVFVTDIDDRSDHNIETLYLPNDSASVDFRVENNNKIYLKTDNRIFEVAL